MPFSRRTTIGSLVLVSFTSISATVRRYVSLISSDLAPEDTWIESEHAWVFVVNPGGLRGGSFVLTNPSLITLLDDTLKMSHASTKMEFMS